MLERLEIAEDYLPATVVAHGVLEDGCLDSR
jgi:hypothetical protein